VREEPMPAGDGTLRLVKGGVPSSGGGAGAAARRPRTRRTVTRRTPTRTGTLAPVTADPVVADPVVEALVSLDAEPATESTVDAEAAEPAGSTADTVHKGPGKPGGPPVRRSTAERTRRRAATNGAGAPVGSPRRGPIDAATRRRRMTTAGVAAVLCLALAVAGFFGSRWYGDRALADAHQQALAAARQVTVNFVSVSASTVDRDLQRVVAGTTGDFHAEFTRGQAQVRQAVVANNVQSQGAVLRAALLSGSRRSATVLIAMDATVHNTNAPDGRVSHYRIQVEVARDAKSGHWLVSRLQFVG
jgi:Mce-associated membrane protein